jgi:hypothetical protein
MKLLAHVFRAAVLLAGEGLAGQAIANDTTAVMATGGLVFKQSDSIRMVSEVLKISVRRIEVDYVFRNVGRVDVATTVAFPLPDLDMRVHALHPTAIPNEGSKNFVNFKTWVEGQEIAPAAEVRSFLREGREITETLRELDLDPLGSIVLDLEKGAKLEALGAAMNGGPDLGFIGEWITRITYHWPQLFPAGKELRIRHTYEPVAGGGLTRPDDEPGAWCLDDSFRAAFNKLLKTGKHSHAQYGYLSGTWVQYVLTTGANWAGPIEQFTLVIDKDGGDLVSTCPIAGLTLRRSGNSFVANAKSFVPKSDLNILFVQGADGRTGPAR